MPELRQPRPECQEEAAYAAFFISGTTGFRISLCEKQEMVKKYHKICTLLDLNLILQSDLFMVMSIIKILICKHEPILAMNSLLRRQM